MMVTNRGRDAAEIEARMSTGRGLLADGGVSISNNWSGDADQVASWCSAGPPCRTAAAAGTSGSSPARRAPPAVWCCASPRWSRSCTRPGGSGVRHLVPRVKRGGSYIFLRAITQRPAPRPERLADHRRAGEGHAGHLLRLRRLRRGRAPRRPDPARVAADPRRPRPGARRAGADHRARCRTRTRSSCCPTTARARARRSCSATAGRSTEVVDDLVDTTKEPVAAIGKSEGWGPVNAFLTELSMRRSVAGTGHPEGTARQGPRRRGRARAEGLRAGGRRGRADGRHRVRQPGADLPRDDARPGAAGGDRAAAPEADPGPGDPSRDRVRRGRLARRGTGRDRPGRGPRPAFRPGRR